MRAIPLHSLVRGFAVIAILILTTSQLPSSPSPSFSFSSSDSLASLSFSPTILYVSASLFVNGVGYSTLGAPLETTSLTVKQTLLVNGIDVIGMLFSVNQKVTDLQSQGISDALDFNALQTKVQDQEDIIAYLRTQLSQLNDTLRAQTVQISIDSVHSLACCQNINHTVLLHSHQITQMQDDISHVKSSQVESDDQISTTQSQIIDLTGRITVAEMNITQLSDHMRSYVLPELNRVDGKLTHHSDEIRSIQMNDVTLSNNIVLLQSSLSANVSSLSTRVSDLESVTPDSSSLITLVLSHSSDISLLTSEMKVNTDILTHHTALFETITSVNSSNLAGTVADLIVTSQTHTTQIAATTLTVQTHTTQINALQLSDTTHTSQISSLQLTATAHLDMITSLLLASESYANQIAAIQTLDGTYTSSISSLSTSISTINSQTPILTNRVTTLEGSSSSSLIRIAALESNITAIWYRITVDESKSDSLSSRISTDELSSSMLETRISSLESNITSLQGRIGGYSTSSSIVNSLASNLTSLQSRVSNQEGASALIASRISLLESNISALVIRVTADEMSASLTANRLTSVESNLTLALTRISVTENSQASLTNRINMDESAASAMAMRVSSLESNLTAVQSRITNDEISASIIAARVSSTELNITSMSNRINSVEGSSALNSALINSHSNQLSALQLTNVSIQSVLNSLSTRISSVELSSGSVASRVSSIENLSGTSALVGNVSYHTSQLASHTMTLSDHSNSIAQMSTLTGTSLLTSTVRSLNSTMNFVQSLTFATQLRIGAVETLTCTSTICTAIGNLTTLVNVQGATLNTQGGTLSTLSNLLGNSALVTSLNSALSLTGSSLLVSTVNGFRSTGCACSGSGSSTTVITRTITLPPTVQDVTSSFTINSPNNGVAVGAHGFNAPFGVAVDSSLNVYVADYNNNRVLFFPFNYTTASGVFGQQGSLTGSAGNYPSMSQNSLYSPTAVTVDSNNGVYIAEWTNNRVLFYNAGSTTAVRVYGQWNSYVQSSPNNGGQNANTLSGPTALACDSHNNLWVVDTTNNRVIFFVQGSNTATKMLGQSSWSSNTANYGGSVSANGLSYPCAIVLDSKDNVYVADRTNNRVLFYLVNSTTASRVYGQLGDFTTATVNKGASGISADSLNGPHGVALDSFGNLFISDTLNNRILFYLAGSTTATRCYGQFGQFTLATVNNGGISANSLNNPIALTTDSLNQLYVVDENNNRVLMCSQGSTTAIRVFGQVY